MHCIITRLTGVAYRLCNVNAAGSVITFRSPISKPTRLIYSRRLDSGNIYSKVIIYSVRQWITKKKNKGSKEFRPSIYTSVVRPIFKTHLHRERVWHSVFLLMGCIRRLGLLPLVDVASKQKVVEKNIYQATLRQRLRWKSIEHTIVQ